MGMTLRKHHHLCIIIPAPVDSGVLQRCSCGQLGNSQGLLVWPMKNQSNCVINPKCEPNGTRVGSSPAAIQAAPSTEWMLSQEYAACPVMGMDLEKCSNKWELQSPPGKGSRKCQVFRSQKNLLIALRPISVPQSPEPVTVPWPDSSRCCWNCWVIFSLLH